MFISPENPCQKPHSSHPSLNCTLSISPVCPWHPFKAGAKLALLLLHRSDRHQSSAWLTSTEPLPVLGPWNCSQLVSIPSAGLWFWPCSTISLLHLCIKDGSIPVQCVGPFFLSLCLLAFAGFKLTRNTQYNSKQANQDIFFCKIFKAFPTSNTTWKEHISHFHVLNLSLIITSFPNHGLSSLGVCPGVHLAQRQDGSFCSLWVYL